MLVITRKASEGFFVSEMTVRVMAVDVVEIGDTCVTIRVRREQPVSDRLIHLPIDGPPAIMYFGGFDLAISAQKRSGKQVRLGIDAPANVHVLRKELDSIA